MKKRPHAIEFTQPSLTQQHQKDEADINNIMKRYIKTGVIDHVNKYSPQYGEFNSIDFQGALNIVAKSQEMFDELPSQVRKRFENDPAGFLDYVDNADRQGLEDLGLLQPNQSTSITSDEPTPPSVDKPTKTPSETAPAATGTAD